MITSFANPTVKYIRKLEQKKFRREAGTFFIEGLRSVGEAIQTGAPIQSLVIAPDLLVSEFGQSLLQDPAVQRIEKIEVSSEIYEKLAHKEGPQGIGAVVLQNWHSLNEVPVEPGDLWVALDAVADPGNLGTIMRTTDAVGGRGIILIGDSTDPYDPSAVKASMGAIFSLHLVKTTWHPFQAWAQNARMMLVGTSDHASQDYQAISYQRPLTLLMGSERHGLSEEMEAACHEIARIPMEGRSDSLNLAVATAVMLYEIYNQSRNLVTIKP
ncbi:MAG: RNA methyltransferase [Anaerolineaceae bacterium]|nr:RNA methyltransferase [Anaerolineaceae bacterium]